MEKFKVKNSIIVVRIVEHFASSLSVWVVRVYRTIFPPRI